MVTAGIRDLKAKFSSYVDIVRSGKMIAVTEHGEEVAIIIPVSNERKAVKSLVKSGKAHWSGDKPKGVEGIKIKGKPLSETVLEGRQ
ncbi:MAG TPA: type II toxin-antitoxin system prevent-host-death family antitoxin [Candidatus Sulfobium mesophilum]|nr:type II toxin-antitoxin system prevent-host-death family antitoxin [Candidatus Sulfobium mesophilum]